MRKQLRKKFFFVEKMKVLVSEIKFIKELPSLDKSYQRVYSKSVFENVLCSFLLFVVCKKILHEKHLIPIHQSLSHPTMTMITKDKKKWEKNKLNQSQSDLQWNGITFMFLFRPDRYSIFICYFFFSSFKFYWQLVCNWLAPRQIRNWHSIPSVVR